MRSNVSRCDPEAEHSPDIIHILGGKNTGVFSERSRFSVLVPPVILEEDACGLEVSFQPSYLLRVIQSESMELDNFPTKWLAGESQE